MTNAHAKLMWENNPTTPITANNLSEAINFHSYGKFIYYTNEYNNYQEWADYVVESNWDVLSPQNYDIGKSIYSFYDNTIRKVIWNSDSQQHEWSGETYPTPFKKILRILARTRISMYYTNISTGEEETINFDFGTEDQIFSIESVLRSDEIYDFNPNSKYGIYLYAKHSYNDTARVKIISEFDESLSFWKSGLSNGASPTGNDVISYRKIGGFRTMSDGTIDELSLWDLYTYRDEITTTRINFIENGDLRQISASDFAMNNDQNIFSSSGQNLTVDEALTQTRALVNNLYDRFYTNRRFGMNLQFAHIMPSQTSYQMAGIDAVALRLTPGFLDVLGNQISIDEPIYFAHPSVGFRINDNPTTLFNVKLKNEDDQTNTSIYPGIWRVYVDYNGSFTFRHEIAENGHPRWIPNYFGWFDTTGKRCIGKFRVRSTNGNYIEKYSVTDTFDINAPTNSIHTHYGTLCPDGLLLCDGKWRDVYGIDTNAYDFEDLPPITSWGDSWYEETPNYTNRMIRGYSDVASVTGGPYNPITNDGGADDYTILGGSDTHSHDFPHNHGIGTLNVLPSGTHPGDHQVDFNGSTAYVEVNTTEEGQGEKVSRFDHIHNMTITGGEHSHQKENFSGKTETLSGGDEVTNSSSSWAPYRSTLICIKKV